MELVLISPYSPGSRLCYPRLLCLAWPSDRGDDRYLGVPGKQVTPTALLLPKLLPGGWLCFLEQPEFNKKYFAYTLYLSKNHPFVLFCFCLPNTTPIIVNWAWFKVRTDSEILEILGSVFLSTLSVESASSVFLKELVVVWAGPYFFSCFYAGCLWKIPYISRNHVVIVCDVLCTRR